MTKRTLVIQSPAALRVRNRQLAIEREGEAAVPVPLCDVACLLLENRQIHLSHPVLADLCALGASVVVCGENRMPNGILLPLDGHVLHAEILRRQITAPEPRKKRLWQTIIRAKIAHQAEVVRACHREDPQLRGMIARVRSGDPDNVEAQAARRYFRRLFGRTFERDFTADGVNRWLNYGYAIVRAALARAICLAGLHPALGIHHRHRTNAFALADDLIEPLRPWVDHRAFRMRAAYPDEPALNPELKRELLSLIVEPVRWDGQRFPCDVAFQRYVTNFRDCLVGDRRKLLCPEPILSEASARCG